jgi:hypothetical protein
MLTAGLCLLAYTLASCVVGVRLLARARRSRGVPELLVGLTYLCAPGLGYPMGIISDQIPNRALALPLNIAGEILLVSGLSCYLFFTVRVFRPEASWAKWGAWLGTAALVYAGVAIEWAVITYPDPEVAFSHSEAPLATLLVVLLVTFGWTGLEGLRYWRMMRKRMALGLAEPAVTNRFLLWGLNGLVSVTWISAAVTLLAIGENPGTHPLGIAVVSAGGVGNTVLLLLIFMPPAWYVRWLERWAARGAALATV